MGGVWLSAERLSPYLSVCGDSPELVVSLYEWNVELGKVLMGDISHFEVALRNRVAHSERLFNPRKEELSPKVVDGSILRLFGSLCPEACRSLYGGNAGKSSVEPFLESAPVPVEVTL